MSPKLPHVKAALERLLKPAPSMAMMPASPTRAPSGEELPAATFPGSPLSSSLPTSPRTGSTPSSPTTSGQGSSDGGAVEDYLMDDGGASGGSLMAASALDPVAALLPDMRNSAYSTDEFRMFSFKVRPCSRAYSHDWTECPFVHPGENARRRDPRRFQYSCVPCPDFRKGACRRGDACEYAHGVFECWLHPMQYRTRLCKDGTGCARRVCFFAHTSDELRPLYAAGAGVGGHLPLLAGLGNGPVAAMSPRSSSPVDMGALSLSPPPSLPPPPSPSSVLMAPPSMFTPSPAGSPSNVSALSTMSPPMSPSASALASAFHGLSHSHSSGPPPAGSCSLPSAVPTLSHLMYAGLGLHIPLSPSSALEDAYTASADTYEADKPSLRGMPLPSPRGSAADAAAQVLRRYASANSTQMELVAPGCGGAGGGSGDGRVGSAGGVAGGASAAHSAVTAALQARHSAAAARRSGNLALDWGSSGHSAAAPGRDQHAGGAPGRPYPEWVTSPGGSSVTCANWGSPTGKPNWGTGTPSGSGAPPSPFRRAASLPLRRTPAATAPAAVQDEPDVSWVQRLVKEEAAGVTAAAGCTAAGLDGLHAAVEQPGAATVSVGWMDQERFYWCETAQCLVLLFDC
eukprot:SM000094S24733  [mRNA]  locus=s94:400669:404281:- [translate_table: standard]